MAKTAEIAYASMRLSYHTILLSQPLFRAGLPPIAADLPCGRREEKRVKTNPGSDDNCQLGPNGARNGELPGRQLDACANGESWRGRSSTEAKADHVTAWTGRRKNRGERVVLRPDYHPTFWEKD